MGATPADARLADPRLGKGIRLEQRLEAGTLGRVWRAFDSRSSESVAARILPPDAVRDRSALRRALKAGTPIVTLRDPHVVGVRELVEERHRIAVVTDYLDAGSLRTVMRSEGPLAPRVAAAVASQVLAGLAAIHAAGLVHGEVRAENVMLASYWRRLSSGSARLADLMVPGLGEPHPATAPDDVLAAGGVLHEMLTGRAPEPGKPLPPLDLPPRLWNVLSGLLAPDPALRPTAASASEQLAGLADALAGLRPLTNARAHRPAAARVGAARYLPAADLTGPAPRLGEPVEHTVARSDVVAPSADDLPVEVRTPWYRRAWIWGAIVGTLLVAAAITWVLFGRPGLPG